MCVIIYGKPPTQSFHSIFCNIVIVSKRYILSKHCHQPWPWVWACLPPVRPPWRWASFRRPWGPPGSTPRRTSRRCARKTAPRPKHRQNRCARRGRRATPAGTTGECLLQDRQWYTAVSWLNYKVTLGIHNVLLETLVHGSNPCSPRRHNRHV